MLFSKELYNVSAAHSFTHTHSHSLGAICGSVSCPMTRRPSRRSSNQPSDQWASRSTSWAKAATPLLRVQVQGCLLYSLHSSFSLPPLKIVPSTLAIETPFSSSFVNYKSANTSLSFICPYSKPPPKVSHKWPSMCLKWAIALMRRIWRLALSSLKGQMMCLKRCFVQCWLVKYQWLLMFLGWFKVCV